MAIDTAAKRKSIIAINLLATGPVIVPDGSITQADRQAIGYSYAGILAVGAGGGVTIPVFIHAYRMRRAR